MIEDLSRRKRNWVLFGIGILVLWLAWSIRAVINPLLLGYLAAYILLPLTRRVEERGYSHTTAVLAVFSAAALATGLLFAAIFVQSRSLLTDILAAAPAVEVQSVPDGQPALPDVEPPPISVLPGEVPAEEGDPAIEPVQVGSRSWLERTFESVRMSVERLLGPGLLPETLPSRSEWQAWARTALMDDPGTQGAVRNAGLEAFQLLMELLRRFAQSLFGISNLAFLVPLYAFFLMFEIGGTHRWVRVHLPVRYRSQLVDVGGRIGAIVSNFFRGRLVLAAIKSVMVALPLWLFGVPYSALVGLAAGFLSLLPFIGGLLAFVLGFGAASISHPWFLALLIAGGIFALAEMIEGYVLVPKILGKSLGLSEVAVLFSITAGGALLGFFGVILALPLAATLKVMFLEFVEPALKQFADESPASKS